nr:MAG TPA: hypothetical protein [Caudoviricetes sp.]
MRILIGVQFLFIKSLICKAFSIHKQNRKIHK